MLKRLFKYLLAVKTKFPLIYSVSLVVLIPITLVANTWWNLHAFQRDMDYSVREKALSAQQAFISLLSTQTATLPLNQVLTNLQTSEPDLVAASILVIQPDNTFKVNAATDLEQAYTDSNLFLNQLAWSQQESYFIKNLDPTTNQNVWTVVTPYSNSEGKQLGLVNFKMSTATIDSLIDRTTRDSIIILFFSVLFVVLLLVNHLRFFERSLLVEKLEQLDKMKDDFISVASHELKSPLTAIKGSLTMIRDQYQNQVPPTLTEWFGIIDSSVVRLNSLVNDLLNVSRIEQNRLDFSLTGVDVRLLIEEVIKQHQFQAAEKKLSLSYQSPPQTVWVLANENRLREVFTNLVSNAVKYTLKGGVTLKSEVDDQTVRIIFQDTGVGIAPEDKEKLFLKFSRIPNDQTRDVPGSGLGLWITKAMVERMEGKIYVDSIIGQGTVFTVTLKLATTAPLPTT